MRVTCARCDAEGVGTPDALPDGWESHISTMSDRPFPLCGACASKDGPSSKSTGNSAAGQLRLLIERIERLEEEKAGNNADIRDVYSEAKATGYDTKVMRAIVKRRKMAKGDLAEFEAILETYEAALGEA